MVSWAQGAANANALRLEHPSSAKNGEKAGETAVRVPSGQQKGTECVYMGHGGCAKETATLSVNCLNYE